MVETFHGSCLCEEIKVTLRGMPNNVGLCHCRDCQKSAGGTCQAAGIYDTTQVEVSDPKQYLKEYVISGERTGSGKPKQKFFCSNCGSPVYNKLQQSDYSNMLVLKLGLLDLPEGVQRPPLEKFVPTTEIYTRTRPSWAGAIPNCQQFNGGS